MLHEQLVCGQQLAEVWHLVSKRLQLIICYWRFDELAST